MTQTACLYLRSSKDRSDVSIDAQRRELTQLATERAYIIVQEYTDVVESAKDELRPGFQRLLRDLKSTERSWRVLMMVDTSRLSRRRYAAQVFKHEARKRGVEIVYSKVPEVDPISNVVLEAVFEAFDEVHSLLSKEKGLAGMAENVKQGYRAGGRAPRGYRLKQVATGAVRDGLPVTKTVLEPSQEAAMVARYLKARAAGRSRKAVMAELALTSSETSLIGMEWNALTYAGHTVWNVHNEFTAGEGYRGGRKRRPRSEWLIQRDTHEALIAEKEAEAILSQLGNSKHAERRRTPASYLLSGLLQTPSGAAWYGDGQKRYRTKPASGPGRYIAKELVEDAVMGKVLEDMQSQSFISQLTSEAKRYAAAQPKDPAQRVKEQLKDINRNLSRTMEFACALSDPAPALRKVEELEQQRKQLADEIARLEKEQGLTTRLAAITEPAVKQLLRGVVQEMRAMQREALKDMLASLTEKIVLDPLTLQCQIHYRIGIEGRNKLASPRGCQPRLPP